MKLLQIFILIILILPSTYAQDDFDIDFEEEPITSTDINIDKSVSWITQQSKTTAEQASLALLAAIKSDSVNNQDAINQLLDFKNKADYCFPSDCNTKDTALALLALSKVGSAAPIGYLNKQQRPNQGGEWLLQIDSQSSGTCSIKYGNSQEQIQVENSRIKSDLCEYSTQFNLNDCIEKGLISNKIFLDLIIQCGPLGSGKISLLYKIENKYFLVGEVSNNVFATLKIKNSNFDDYESTIYASWALKSMGKDPNTIVWLKRFYTPSIESSSLMYLITEEDNFIDDLLVFQDTTTGSFGDVFETSLATLALRKQAQNTIEIGLAKSWLQTMMLDDYSWNKDIKDSSMAIYGVFSPLDIEVIPTTPSSFVSEEPAPTCNEDGVCDSFLDETAENCPSDCTCGDTICDDSENEFSCPEDCEKVEEYYDEDYEEDEEGRGFFFWFIIFLLLILGGLAFFYYKFYYKTGKQLFKFKKPSYPKQPPLLKQPQMKRPAYQPQYRKPAYKPRKTLAEKQLEESMKEARKLLGKK